MKAMPTSPARAAAPPTGPSPALVHDITSAKARDGFGHLTLGEGDDAAEYPIIKKPSPLLLVELGRQDSDGSAEAVGLIGELLEQCLGADGYKAYRKHFYRLDKDFDDLQEVVRSVVEATMGRPT